MARRIAWTLITLAVLAGGVMLARKLLRERPHARPAPTWTGPVPVDVVEAQRAEAPIVVEALGTVQPAHSVRVVPEVSGKIVEVSPKLEAGRVVGAGEVLFRIDPRDYEAAVAQARAQLAQAKLQLELEQSRAGVASAEWKALRPKVAGRRDLVLRKPHIRAAKAAVAAARAALEDARARLERTVVKAPFEAVVLDENVEVGQVVGPGAPVATLVGTDVWWVDIPLARAELEWVALPRGQQAGSTVEVEAVGGPATGADGSWRTGHLLRLLPQVSTATRMVRVLAEVADPLGLEADSPAAPLVLGTLARVRIRGRTPRDAVRIPRVALREGDRVWTVGDGNHLHITAVHPMRKERDAVYVPARELSPGTRVVTSLVAVPVEGMEIAPRAKPALAKGRADGAGTPADPAAAPRPAEAAP